MARRYKKQHPSEPYFFLVIILLAVLAALAPASLTADNAMFIIGVIFSIAAIIVLVLLFVIWRRHQQAQKLLRALKLSDIDLMEGTAFEQYIGTLLESQGYKVTYTASTGDYGIDIVATKNNQRLGVQIKRYSGSVDQKAVREAVAGLATYTCTAAMVITNSYFTQHAKDLALANHCTLIDRDELAKWIYKFQQH